MSKTKEEYFISLKRGLFSSHYEITFRDKSDKECMVVIASKDNVRAFCAWLSGQNYVSKKSKVFLFDTFHVILEERGKNGIEFRKQYRVTGYSDAVPLKYSIRTFKYGTAGAKDLYNALRGRK